MKDSVLASRYDSKQIRSVNRDLICFTTQQWHGTFWAWAKTEWTLQRSPRLSTLTLGGKKRRSFGNRWANNDRKKQTTNRCLSIHCVHFCFPNMPCDLNCSTSHKTFNPPLEVQKTTAIKGQTEKCLFFYCYRLTPGMGWI